MVLTSFASERLDKIVEPYRIISLLDKFFIFIIFIDQMHLE